jgi:hypothetical protein
MLLAGRVEEAVLLWQGQVVLLFLLGVQASMTLVPTPHLHTFP